jgi:hypothetical protein
MAEAIRGNVQRLAGETLDAARPIMPNDPLNSTIEHLNRTVRSLQALDR